MKVSEIIGRKVFTINSGTYMENVDDVVYDPKINTITAVLIDRGGWFSDAKVILFKDIKTIGHDAILIDNEQVVKKASQLVPSITEIIKGNTFLTSTKIITESGNALGTISDLLFDPKTGIVSDLEVSQGAIKNIQSGKKRIPISSIVTIGKDRIIVTSATESQIQNQVAAKKAPSQATRSAENTKQKSTEAAQSIQSGIKTVSQKAKQKLKEFNQQPAVKQFKQNIQETKQNIQSSVNEEKSISQSGQKTVFKNTDSNEKNSDAQQHTHV